MYGGGLDIWYSNVTIDKSTFENNAALEQGGAILAMYSDVLITDSTFEENNAKVSTRPQGSSVLRSSFFGPL